jgi:hypothetical protein
MSSKATMKVEALDHVQLAMPPGRENEARAFYEGVLGIPEVAKPDHLATRGGAWFQRGRGGVRTRAQSPSSFPGREPASAHRNVAGSGLSARPRRALGWLQQDLYQRL